MGKRGPRPTPTIELLARGAKRGKARIRHKEAQPERGACEPPAWLDAKAHVYWEQLKAHLDRAGLMADLYTPMLGLLCDRIVTYIESAEAVREQGEVYITKAGNRMQNPMAGVRNHAFRDVERLLARFGASPTDVVGLKSVADQGEVDEFTKHRALLNRVANQED